jgi:hypothetical protein
VSRFILLDSFCRLVSCFRENYFKNITMLICYFLLQTLQWSKLCSLINKCSQHLFDLFKFQNLSLYILGDCQPCSKTSQQPCMCTRTIALRECAKPQWQCDEVSSFISLKCNSYYAVTIENIVEGRTMKTSSFLNIDM